MKIRISFLLFCLFFFSRGAVGQTPVDIFVDMNTSTPGTRLTSAILASGTHGTGISSWSANSAALTVGAVQPGCHNSSSFVVNGTTYSPSNPYQGIALADSSSFATAMANFSSNKTKLTWAGCIVLGYSPANGLADLVRFDSVKGDLAVLQLNASGPGNCFCLNIETTPNGVTTHTAYFPVSPNVPYWCELYADESAGVAKASCYSTTPPFTVVGSVSTNSGPSGTTITDVQIGNDEAVTTSGTTYFENFVMDYTNAAYPLVNGQQPLWTGILSASRAVDWSTAGVAGGIPTNYTQCGSTVTAGTSATAIQSDLAACPKNTFLLLGAGNFSLSSGMTWNVGNRILRGMGPDQTFLTFTGGLGCGGESAQLCIRAADGNWPGGATHSATFSGAGPWPRGTTQITLSSVAGLAVGNSLVLDQVDDASGTETLTSNPDPGDIYICDAGGNGSNGCSENGSGNEESGAQRGGGTNSVRDQAQIVTVTAINGTTVTFTPGLYMSNWRSSQSPGAYWSGNPVVYFGVEDLSIDGTNGGTSYNVEFVNCLNCWVKGVRSVNPGRSHFTAQYSGRVTFRDSYLYGNSGSGSNCSGSRPCYGIELFGTSDTLEENNIIQKTSAPMMINGYASGTVLAYNFAINNIYTGSSTWDQNASNTHSAVDSVLWEGNVADGVYMDLFHGTGHLNTAFRNRFTGRAINNGTLTTSHTNPFLVYPYHRYTNLIGNVLGTSGYHTNYTALQGSSGNTQDKSIYVVGTGTQNCCSAGDPLTVNSLMRWGNYDTVNNAVRFLASEVPSAFNDTHTPSLYVNPVPASQVLPASFYLSTKPTWWPASIPWPPIGPDVTGGNLANVAGHANMNPAEACYTNTMGGPADGTGAALTFSPSVCYRASSPVRPAPVTNLKVTVQ